MELWKVQQKILWAEVEEPVHDPGPPHRWEVQLRYWVSYVRRMWEVWSRLRKTQDVRRQSGNSGSRERGKRIGDRMAFFLFIHTRIQPF